MTLEQMAYIFVGGIPLLLILLALDLTLVAWLVIYAIVFSFLVCLLEGIWSSIAPPPLRLVETANFIKNAENYSRKWLKNNLHSLFYQRLRDRHRTNVVRIAILSWVEKHFPVFFMCMWALPWVLLSLHYLSAVGCRYNITRSSMETSGLCLPKSQPNSTIEILKLWENHADITDYPETHPEHILTILLSHISMSNVQLTLVDYDVKLRAARPGGIEEDEVMDTLLSKSYILPTNFLKAYFLCPRLEQSISIASSLIPQMQHFCQTLCMKKDLMTVALQSFANTYSEAIALSDYGGMSLASFVFCPWCHALRLLNRPWLTWYLPVPRVYVFEIEAELRFQKARLIATIHKSLAVLHANSPAIGNFDSTEQAIRTFATQLEKVEHMIHKSDSSRWPGFPKSDKTLKLQEYYMLLKVTQDYLAAVIRIAKVYETMLSELWIDLQHLRQIFSKGLPSRFTPTVLPSLHAKISSVSAWQSSSINEGRDGSRVSDIPTNASLFGYSLNNIDDTQLSACKAEIARYCKAGDIWYDPESDLHTICTIYGAAVTISGLDRDTLSTTARSWVIESAILKQKFEAKRWDLDGVQRALETQRYDARV